MLNKYKNFLFDLDGTLTDPKEGIVNSYVYSLEKLGIKNSDRELLSTYIGHSIHLIFTDEYGITEKDIDLAVNYYREYFGTKGIYENKVYQGIPEILKTLKDKNKDIYLVTSKPSVYAKEILNHFKLSEYFTEIYGSGLTSHNTGKEELIRETLSKSALSYKESLMIGDRKHDIIGANSNYVDSAAVTYGFGKAGEFTEFNPTYMAHSVIGLSELLLN